MGIVQAHTDALRCG